MRGKRTRECPRERPRRDSDRCSDQKRGHMFADQDMGLSVETASGSPSRLLRPAFPDQGAGTGLHVVDDATHQEACRTSATQPALDLTCRRRIPRWR
jgi:hypothetical protein